MRVPLRALAVFVCLAFSSGTSAQEGHPMVGSWHGNWGLNAKERHDLTLIVEVSGQALDMGTPFDDFTALSHHGRCDLPAEVQRNRAILLGLMTAAGWDWNRSEWWHYQLFDPKRYPLLADAAAPRPLMAA